MGLEGLKRRGKKESRSGLGRVLLTYVYEIVVYSECGSLLRHRVVTTTKKYKNKKF